MRSPQWLEVAFKTFEVSITYLIGETIAVDPIQNNIVVSAFFGTCPSLSSPEKVHAIFSFVVHVAILPSGSIKGIGAEQLDSSRLPNFNRLGKEDLLSCFVPPALTFWRREISLPSGVREQRPLRRKNGNTHIRW